MALKTLSACTVFVPKPPHMSYSDAMSRLHLWLDYKKIQLVSFKITTGGRVGFELMFASERDAAEFHLFDWPRL
jgi:hypothetical protein